MKKSQYRDSKILGILKQTEAGMLLPELCREHGMSSAIFYKFCAWCDGITISCDFMKVA